MKQHEIKKLLNRQTELRKKYNQITEEYNMNEKILQKELKTSRSCLRMTNTKKKMKT